MKKQIVEQYTLNDGRLINLVRTIEIDEEEKTEKDKVIEEVFNYEEELIKDIFKEEE